MIKVCLNDAVKFEAQRDTAKFCSAACRVAYARANDIDETTGEVSVTTSVGSVTTDPTIAWRRYEDPNDELYIDNPFDRPGDPDYDREKALKAFKKMGLDEVSWITTGIKGFDELTQIPRGRLTQIEGRYSAGKTTLCLNMVRGLVASKKKVLYVDTEASLNPSLLADLKLDDTKFDLYNKSAYLEDITVVLRKAITDGKYDMIVLDSLAMCTTKTVAESDITASNIGQKAKIFNKFLELVMGDLRDTGTALVIINQTRDKIGTYTPETYTPGGSGKDYNASLMISLKTIKSWRFGRTASDTKAKKFIGQEVEATIIKSKVNTPWRTAKFKLYYPSPRVEPETQF
jgi:RecA/RadA recombinase